MDAEVGKDFEPDKNAAEAAANSASDMAAKTSWSGIDGLVSADDAVDDDEIAFEDA